MSLDSSTTDNFENTMAKREVAYNEQVVLLAKCFQLNSINIISFIQDFLRFAHDGQFLLLPQCFQKPSPADVSKYVCKRDEGQAN